MDSINSSISLEGSASLVLGFFECSLNSILYLRGLYPVYDFKTTTRYGNPVLMCQDPELTAYIEEIKQQLNVWLKKNTINKLVIAIKSKDTLEVLERWHFDIEVNKENDLPMAENIPPEETQAIQRKTVNEIRTILRQIAASVSYLPELEEDCTFNILVYANQDVEVPVTWRDDGPNLIAGGGTHVRLKSFSTLVHNIQTYVAYKMDEDN